MQYHALLDHRAEAGLPSTPERDSDLVEMQNLIGGMAERFPTLVAEHPLFADFAQFLANPTQAETDEEASDMIVRALRLELELAELSYDVQTHGERPAGQNPIIDRYKVETPEDRAGLFRTLERLKELFAPLVRSVRAQGEIMSSSIGTIGDIWVVKADFLRRAGSGGGEETNLQLLLRQTDGTTKDGLVDCVGAPRTQIVGDVEYDPAAATLIFELANESSSQ